MTTATPHPSRRPRGRPRKPTVQVRVRLPEAIFDRICQVAMRKGINNVAGYVRRYVINSVLKGLEL